MLLWLVALVTVFIFGGVLAANGTGGEFLPIVIRIGAGLFLIFLVIGAGLLLAHWIPWLGFLFIAIVVLYAFSWMLKD